MAKTCPNCGSANLTAVGGWKDRYVCDDCATAFQILRADPWETVAPLVKGGQGRSDKEAQNYSSTACVLAAVAVIISIGTWVAILLR